MFFQMFYFFPFISFISGHVEALTTHKINIAILHFISFDLGNQLKT